MLQRPNAAEAFDALRAYAIWTLESAWFPLDVVSVYPRIACSTCYQASTGSSELRVSNTIRSALRQILPQQWVLMLASHVLGYIGP